MKVIKAICLSFIAMPILFIIACFLSDIFLIITTFAKQNSEIFFIATIVVAFILCFIVFYDIIKGMEEYHKEK